MSNGDARFGFGRNWQSFVDHAMDPRRVVSATGSMRRLLPVDGLAGKAFLDIGYGSGLSSLAACELGAGRIVSFDYDPQSVEASLALRERAGIKGDRCMVTQGSILDPQFLRTLDPADIVYSWGVLHHTGAMWQAIDNAVSLVKPGGVLAIAIYNNVERRVGGSGMWWRVKRLYNRAPGWAQRLLEYGYAGSLVLRYLLSGRNPLTVIRSYDADGRGMDFWHDVRDWAGGFPYEYATAGEVFTYLHGKHGLELVYLNTHDGHGCNEFTFRRPG